MIKIGDLIAGRYEIQDKIGAGGMSDVYRAYDNKLNRAVAVKVLKQEFSDNADFLSKFRVEAQAAAGLMHPNIVNVYDVGEESGSHYMVMELVEGITLKRYIEKKARLAVKEAVSIAIQVSNGIESAHNNHIIHRDIKPQNIIISKDGKVKVTDFGIAKAATSNTITSNVMGSVHYTSPEQVRGGFSDEKSDIYSLGITLFEMLTGRVPFNGDTTVAVAIKHIQEPMPSPRDYISEIPVSVEQIVMKCTQKSPDRRYQVVPELIEDLKKSLISPDEDFVKIESPENTGKTRNIDANDLSQIRKARTTDMVYRGNSGMLQITPDNPTGKMVPLKTVDERYYEEEFEEYTGDDYEVFEEEEIKPLPRKKSSDSNSGSKKSSSSKKNTKSRKKADDDYDPKMEAVTTVIIVIIAIIIGGIFLFVVGKAVGIFGTEENATPLFQNPTSQGTTQTTGQGTGEVVTDAEGVVLEDYRGMSKAEAVAKLESAGFVVNAIGEANLEYEKDLVCGMEPTYGSKVARGSAITLKISLGDDASALVVPNLLSGGMSEEDAKVTLQELGLVPVKDGDEYSDTVAAGDITYQSVAAGTAATPGQEVNYKVSLGQESTLYNCAYSVQIPAGYAGGTAKIILTGSDGTQLYNSDTTAFPVDIVISNIQGASSGELQITYTIEQEQEITDADGNVTLQKIQVATTSEPIHVEFAKAN